MSFFDYSDGVLCAEGVALPAIADVVGTPVHVYSASALRHAADAFTSALRNLPSARIAFAVKANPIALSSGCSRNAATAPTSCRAASRVGPWMQASRQRISYSPASEKPIGS